jgi:hypothetical protein
MPIFTVIVKDDKTGNTKTVTVDTGTMVATVVAEEPKTVPVVAESTMTTEPVAEPVAESVAEPVAEPVAESVAEPVVEPVAEPVAPVEQPQAKSNGGKRSAHSFRLKKRRITRKLKKTR